MADAAITRCCPMARCASARSIQWGHSSMRGARSGRHPCSPMPVFSVPLSAPLLRAVIAALIDGKLVAGFEARAHPEKLAEATLYLPTRRAGRMAREIFLDELKADAAVLPRIVALGDIDEDELAFAEEAEQYGGAAPLDIPPKLGELDRRLTLARLVAAWARSPVSAPLVVGGPASTLALAGDLARLMGDMVTRGGGWEAVRGLGPEPPGEDL